MPKQVHWTQRPENRNRVKHIMAKAHAARTNGHTTVKEPITTAELDGMSLERLIEEHRHTTERLQSIATAIQRRLNLMGLEWSVKDGGEGERVSEAKGGTRAA